MSISISPVKKHRRNEFSLTSSSQGGTPSPNILSNEQNPFEFTIQKEVDKRMGRFYVKKFLNDISNWKHVDIFIILSGFVIGLIYFVHTRRTFETLTQFSQLSNAERELSLPIDHAFRYTYYKKIAGAKSLRDGLQSILYDKCTKWPKVINAFRVYFLTQEVLIGGTYHAFKNIASIFNFRKSSTCSYGPMLEEQTQMMFEHNEIIENAGLNCNSIIGSSGDLMYFYFIWIWLLESFTVGLLVYFGVILSESGLGGIMTGICFIISHPQRTHTYWIYPGHPNLEWTAALIHTYLISTLVLRKIHPPWITSLKIGIGTGVLILMSEKEAQWVLLSQLLVVMLMEIWGQLSPYFTSLVISGQIAGWQYASLVHMDTSFVNWSMYFYTLTTVIITLHLFQPLLNWVLGRARRQKLIFLRRTILLIAFKMILIAVWTESNKKLGLPEDRRFRFLPGNMSDMNIIPLTRSEDQVNQGRRVEFPALEPERIEPDFHQGESAILSRVFTCFYQPRFRIGFQVLFRKYFLHGFGLVYLVILGISNFVFDSRYQTKSDTSNSSPGSASLETRLVNTGESRVITFTVVQTLVFVLWTLCLDRRWELLLTSHLCLLLALLFHRKVQDWYRKLGSLFGIGVPVHWGVIAGLLACLLAMRRLESEQMYRNSRGSLGLGKPGVTELLETVNWIKGNTNVTTCALLGLEFYLVPIHLGSGRGCVNHNQVHDLHFMMAATASDEVDHTFNRYSAYNRSENTIYDDPLRKRLHREILGESEEKVLLRIYSMFRKDLTFQEYWDILTPLRATHLVLSKAVCAGNLGVKSDPVLEYYRRDSNEESRVYVDTDSDSTKCDLNHLWSNFKPTAVSSGDVTTVCSRLLSQRNISPFKKLFENQGFMILALDHNTSIKLKSKKVNSKKTNKN